MNQEQSWTIDCWKQYPISQMPLYQDQQLYQQTLQKIRNLPPLLTFNEIHTFKEEMVRVSKGEKFVIQLGDCAETFAECTEKHWKEKFSFYDKMGQILDGIVIGRVCGQFAKPRSQLHEKDGTLNYRGDLINSINKDDRDPDPLRLIQGANLSKRGLEQLKQYEGINPVWTSHECLHLGYESSFVRQNTDQYYLSNTHFPWIGDRTRIHDHAHSNFAKGLYNPLGIKIGQTITKTEFINIVKLLNPKNEDGRLFAIIRLGRNKLDRLNDIVNWKQENQLNVSFFLDPMHGNTVDQCGHKIRRIEDIMYEIQHFFTTLEQYNEKPCGLHLECTPYDVSECIENDEDIISKKYTTTCDPRLNYKQTKKIVVFVNSLLKKLKKT